MYPKLTDEQLAAVKMWADENGRNWKSKLWTGWMMCNLGNFYYSNILHNLRNSHGPSWLNSFNLKKALGESNLIEAKERD